MQPKVTILTTTYNRAELLRDAYRSLKAQTCQEFQWLVIDDGSPDHTAEVMAELQADSHEFELNYYRKKNGGKHTAWNFSHPYIKGDWVGFLDDDDQLTPDAVETILQYADKYGKNSRIWCLTFQRKYLTTGQVICDWEGSKEIISNHIAFRINGGVAGDCMDVVRRDVFQSYTYPTFGNERFMFGESPLWMTVGWNYDTVYIKYPIYMSEYLEGGQTTSGRAMRLKNPLGGMYASSLYLRKGVRLSVRAKHAILYDCYAIASGHLGQSLGKSPQKGLCGLMLPFGAFFYLKWSRGK